MVKRIAFLVRQTRMNLILLAMMCFLGPAEAQHGGGGGHSAGGHFGGGHSSGGHTGGGHNVEGRTSGHHFGWLHFGSGIRSARRARGLGEASSPARSRYLPAEPAKGATLVRAVPSAHIRAVALKSVWFPLGNSFFFSFGFPPSFFFPRFPCFHSSGCFFNGFTQVCFFEPALPLFFISSGLDPFRSGFAFDGNSRDIADGSNTLDAMQPGVTADLSTAGPVDAESPEREISSPAVAEVDAATEAAGKPVAKRFFLLILTNGTRHRVADYWLADGYIEYVSLDGTRSHIPLEALDLQATVIENSHRGLPFVLRSTR